MELRKKSAFYLSLLVLEFPSPKPPEISLSSYICYFIFLNTFNVIFVGFQEARGKETMNSVNILPREVLADV